MTAPSPELETAAEELARLFANARTHGNVYMDGSHNPLPSEDKAAERFVSNVRVEERARFADLVAAIKAVVADLDGKPWRLGRTDSPGHHHQVPGIWDDDNRTQLAGTACEQCRRWSRLAAALAALGEDQP